MKPVQIQELTFITLNNEIQSMDEVSKRANGIKIIETKTPKPMLGYLFIYFVWRKKSAEDTTNAINCP